MSDTTHHLMSRYGPLLSVSDLAGLLQRSKEGLRITLRGNTDLAKKLCAARVKIGRRVHFKTAVVGAVIDGATDK